MADDPVGEGCGLKQRLGERRETGGVLVGRLGECGESGKLVVELRGSCDDGRV
jgi:hypothetical protein